MAERAHPTRQTISQRRASEADAGYYTNSKFNNTISSIRKALDYSLENEVMHRLPEIAVKVRKRKKEEEEKEKDAEEDESKVLPSINQPEKGDAAVLEQSVLYQFAYLDKLLKRCEIEDKFGNSKSTL